MCVGVPSEIKEIRAGVIPMAVVDVAGTPQEVSLMYLPQAQVGEYVLIQHGFAVTLLTAAEAAESLQAWQEIGVLDAQGLPAATAEQQFPLL